MNLIFNGVQMIDVEGNAWDTPNDCLANCGNRFTKDQINTAIQNFNSENGTSYPTL
jgi:hypothetical protein